MPSFDIVSRVDLAEVDNAIASIKREISTRFDFKGSKSTIDRDEAEIKLVADDDLKLKQMQALFDQEAKKYQVLPHNNDTFARALAPRPSATEVVAHSPTPSAVRIAARLVGAVKNAAAACAA